MEVWQSKYNDIINNIDTGLQTSVPEEELNTDADTNTNVDEQNSVSAIHREFEDFTRKELDEDIHINENKIIRIDDHDTLGRIPDDQVLANMEIIWNEAKAAAEAVYMNNIGDIEPTNDETLLPVTEFTIEDSDFLSFLQEKDIGNFVPNSIDYSRPELDNYQLELKDILSYDIMPSCASAMKILEAFNDVIKKYGGTPTIIE